MKEWPKDLYIRIGDLMWERFNSLLEQLKYENELLVEEWQQIQNRRPGQIVELWVEEDE